MNKRNKIIMITLLMLGIITITLGIAYARYRYYQPGYKVVSIESSNIKLHYNEKDMNGINILNALPVSDDQGKQQDYFEFEITSTSSTSAIPYIITARIQEEIENQIPKNYINVYLTEVNNGVETEKLLSTYSDLVNVLKNNNIEQELFRTEVPEGTSNYSKTYRLRMWINEDADYSPTEVNGEQVYPLTNKTFSIKINVHTKVKLEGACEQAFNIVGSPKQELEVGDEVKIGTEHFLVVSTDSSNTVLIAKYNLALVGFATMPGSEEGKQYVPTAEFLDILRDKEPWSDDSDGFIHYGNVPFSAMVYYEDDYDLLPKYRENDLYDGYYPFIYDNDYKGIPDYDVYTCLPSDLAEEDDNNGNSDNWDNYSTQYGNVERVCGYSSEIGDGVNSYYEYIDSMYYFNPDYSIAYYMNDYKKRLEKMDATINKVRTINLTEFDAIKSYFNDYNTYDKYGMLKSFWIGITDEYEGLWYVGKTYYDGYENNLSFEYYNSTYGAGVRPALEVPTCSINYTN